MSNEISTAQDSVTASLIANRTASESVGAGGVFTATCVGPDGQVKWTDTFHNLVVNEGLVSMNTSYFKGSGYTAAFFLGLVSGATSPTYAAGNTIASHAGWTELVPGTAYTGNRPAVTFGTSTSANPSVITSTAVSYAMLVNSTVVAGAFLCTVASGTSGTLFSAGSFTGGNKSVDSGDTLNVTYSFSLTGS
jgi:hypothetical protein